VNNNKGCAGSKTSSTNILRAYIGDACVPNDSSDETKSDEQRIVCPMCIVMCFGKPSRELEWISGTDN